MNLLAFAHSRALDTALLLAAAVAALFAFAPQVHAGQSFDRPASYDVRDVCTSTGTPLAKQDTAIRCTGSTIGESLTR